MLRFCIILTVPLFAIQHGNADEAAEHYLLAALACDPRLPEFVEYATTDHPTLGFGKPIADEHRSFLKQPAITHALSHFDAATSKKDCDWQRYIGFSWSDGHLNDRLHQLARVVLFRARTFYDCGQWVEGNRDVERVRIMTRHMTNQARPREHQCFMVENMAVFTAAAYILRFPAEALTDLSERHDRLGVFSPMRGMLSRESSRIFELAVAVQGGRITPADGFLLSGYADEGDRIQDMSTDTAVHELRGLATFLEQLSQQIEIHDQSKGERVLDELTRQGSDGYQLIARLGDYAVNEYRENAQAVCRNAILTLLLDRLSKGIMDLSTIPDPYGAESLQLKDADAGVCLVSKLVHINRIEFDLGAAGKK